MEPTKANYALLSKLESVNIDLGYGKLEPLDPSKRGAADISFVAPHVDEALAGMGPDGSGAHSENESLDLSSIPKNNRTCSNFDLSINTIKSNNLPLR